MIALGRCAPGGQLATSTWSRSAPTYGRPPQSSGRQWQVAAVARAPAPRQARPTSSSACRRLSSLLRRCRWRRRRRPLCRGWRSAETQSALRPCSGGATRASCTRMTRTDWACSTCSTIADGGCALREIQRATHKPIPDAGPAAAVSSLQRASHHALTAQHIAPRARQKRSSIASVVRRVVGRCV